MHCVNFGVDVELKRGTNAFRFSCNKARVSDVGIFGLYVVFALGSFLIGIVIQHFKLKRI